MTERDPEVLVSVIIIGLLLCCCCSVLIAGGLGAFFYARSRQKKPAPLPEISVPSSPPQMTPLAPEPASVAEAEPFQSEAPTPFTAPPEPPAPMPGPATPIESDDIRAKLLELNAADKPYVVQATGYKIVIAPTAITGYLLEIAFDYVERVARFVETNAANADPRLKDDARQVLEANGWEVRA